jgi:indolepyruvate ferredoxin oxidoreductase beta subunit
MTLSSTSSCQIVISGVGGQGVLFITKLLAEAAIEKGLPVFTSETHGMAQRGGTVISHLKVGRFSSPLITPGQANGIIALKAENIAQHGGYLRTGGWAALNSATPVKAPTKMQLFCQDADRLAQQINDPRSVNLIVLGFALGVLHETVTQQHPLFCGVEDVAAVLKQRLQDSPPKLEAALRALQTGAGSTYSQQPKCSHE